MALRPELVVGVVTPVGVDTGALVGRLRTSLQDFGYRTPVIKISEHLPAAAPPPGEPEDVRIRRLVSAGNDYCRSKNDASATARLVIREILRTRLRLNATPGEKPAVSLARPAWSTAYLVHSLKRPAEVSLLRAVYGPQFVLVGAQGTHDERVAELAARPLSAASPDERRRIALELIELDAREHDEMGQRVNDTYPQADYFLTLTEPTDRFVRLLFGAVTEPATEAEHAMYVARATGARSLSPSRKVGAALVAAGSVVALGRNDVPEGELPDVATGVDASEEFKTQLVGDTVRRLMAKGWQPPEGATGAPEVAAAEALAGGQLMSVIEYQRSVHAEVEAISDAARRGVAVAGTTLYVTTYPCHLCYKAALAVNVAEVRYIEPYPKSRALAMYPSSGGRLKPYEGVAPRMYMRVFDERPPVVSQGDGTLATVPPDEAQPLLPNVRAHDDIHRAEIAAVTKLKQEA
jgi:cytidine deaminase